MKSMMMMMMMMVMVIIILIIIIIGHCDAGASDVVHVGGWMPVKG